MASNIKTDSGVRRIVNRKYYDVTGETFRNLYPTKDWNRRYNQAVYGGR